MFRTAMTLDRTHRNLTLVSGVLIAAVTATALTVGPSPARAVIAVVVAALALSWAMSPRAVAVDASELRIERRLWPALHVARSEIESAAPLDSMGGKAIRLWGVGGFFGSYGLFWSDKLGRFRLYGTRRGQAVVVVRKGTLLPLVLTPDDVAGTIGAIDPRATFEERA
jgi:PH (Pleckstrin Homology) domain-containing protein